MKIIHINQFDDYHNEEACVLCLGYFDAVHLGHVAMINKAKESGLPLAVMTFSEPPLFVLKKRTEQISLTSLFDKAELFEELGVETLFVLEFNEETSKLSRFEFIDKILKKINPSLIMCGEDYAFGYQKEGTPKYLSNYFNVEIFNLVEMGGEKISSRMIRRLIIEGNVKEASKYLGRPYRICGLVKHGFGNGKGLGFPTANIDLDYPYVWPKEGVYMGYGIVRNKRVPAIISIGRHPTVIQLDAPIIEIHLIDFDGDLYGQSLYVEFVAYMRENQKFESKEALIDQLKKDRQKAKRLLK